MKALLLVLALMPSLNYIFTYSVRKSKTKENLIKKEKQSFSDHENIVCEINCGIHSI
jgi:hypothetical protein